MLNLNNKHDGVGDWHARRDAAKLVRLRVPRRTGASRAGSAGGPRCDRVLADRLWKVAVLPAPCNALEAPGFRGQPADFAVGWFSIFFCFLSVCVFAFLRPNDSL